MPPAVVPTLEEARALARRGNLIPVYRELLADMETPVSVYRKLSRDTRYSFLLESVEGGEHLARYSFIGAAPQHVATLHNHRATVRRAGARPQANGASANGSATAAAGRSSSDEDVVSESHFDDPLAFVRDLLAPYKPVPLPDMPRFQGGAVGYLAYECVRYFEDLPSPERDDLQLPDAVLMLADTLVVFDHVKHRMRVLAHADLVAHNGNVDSAYAQALTRIDSLVSAIQSPVATDSDPAQDGHWGLVPSANGPGGAGGSAPAGFEGRSPRGVRGEAPSTNEFPPLPRTGEGARG